MSKSDGFWSRQRDPWPVMTSNMMAVLDYLRQAKQKEWPFVLVEDVDRRTLQALVDRDWVFESVAADGSRYSITERGERAYKAYEKPLRRNDGICPTCGIRPKHVTKSGIKIGYCLECDAEAKRGAYRLRRPKVKDGRMCSRCGKRPVHVLAGGRPISYCLHCKNLRNRRGKKRWRKDKLKRVQTGEVLICTRPGCTRPRHVTPSSVYELCREHYREWHNEYRHRKRALTPAKKGGRPRKSQVQA